MLHWCNADIAQCVANKLASLQQTNLLITVARTTRYYLENCNLIELDPKHDIFQKTRSSAWAISFHFESKAPNSTKSINHDTSIIPGYTNFFWGTLPKPNWGVLTSSYSTGCREWDPPVEHEEKWMLQLTSDLFHRLFLSLTYYSLKISLSAQWDLSLGNSHWTPLENQHLHCGWLVAFCYIPGLKKMKEPQLAMVQGTTMAAEILLVIGLLVIGLQSLNESIL
jgi:hypothetical protein